MIYREEALQNNALELRVKNLEQLNVSMRSLYSGWSKKDSAQEKTNWNE